MDNRRVLVLGASLKPERYANKAIKLLRRFNFDVEAIGNRAGRVEDVEIKKDTKDVSDIHTVTIYLSPRNQEPYYDFIKNLSPARVIFNPGTENDVFEDELEKENVEVVENCTLVMLNYDMF